MAKSTKIKKEVQTPKFKVGDIVIHPTTSKTGEPVIILVTDPVADWSLPSSPQFKGVKIFGNKIGKIVNKSELYFELFKDNIVLEN